MSFDKIPSPLVSSGDDELDGGDDDDDEEEEEEESITLELDRENPCPLSLWCKITLDVGTGAGGGGGGGFVRWIFPFDVVCGNDSECINPRGDERNVGS